MFIAPELDSGRDSIALSARSLMVRDLRLEIKGSRLESGCWLCAEVSSLQ